MYNLNGRKGPQLQSTDEFTIEGYQEKIKQNYKKLKENSIAFKYKKQESTGGTRKSYHQRSESNGDDPSYKSRRDVVAWVAGKRRLGKKYGGMGGVGGLTKSAEMGGGDQDLFG